MSLETFNQYKADFLTAEKPALAIQAELTKNGNILEALRNELDELIKRHKAKLAETGEISADEYVELKQQDAGYKARIEYYSAMQEELEENLYQAQEKLFSIRRQASKPRGEYLFQEANNLFLEVIQNNKEAFDKIFCYLSKSGKFKNENLSLENQVLEHLKYMLFNNIDSNKQLESELRLSSEALSNFTPRRPTETHRIQTENANKKTGLSALFENLK